MSKKFIVFAGVIFIIVFGVMQIAVISILGVNANINLDRTIAIFSGFFSLFGGIIGATGAYFIAREQIKKQDSDRIVDLKIKNYSEIDSNVKIIIKKLEQLANDIIDLKDDNLYNLKNADRFIDLTSKISDDIEICITNIEDREIYFKMMKLSNEELVDFVYHSTFWVRHLAFKEIKPFNSHIIDIHNSIDEIKRMNNLVNKELEKILLN